MFIKHSDGKITTVFETDELTEEQKKSVNNLSKKMVKQSKDEIQSNNDESGRY